MSEEELFVLTSVVELWTTLDRLGSSNRSEFFNLREPRFKSTSLRDTVIKLIRQGDLIVQREANSELVGDPFNPTLLELSDALSGRSILAYRLSAQGGSRWEAAVQPRWNLFVDTWVSYDPDEGEIAAGDRGLIEAYRDAWPYIGGNDEIIVGTETWETLRPWQATYWKTLPHGYRVRFRVKRIEPVMKPKPERIWDLIWDTNHWNWPAGEFDELQKTRERVKALELRAGRLMES
jgi:hypothetical protein